MVRGAAVSLFSLVAVAIAIVATVLQGAPVSPPAPSPSPSPAADEYRVGPGDILDVVVFGNDDLSRAAPVQTDGTVNLPLLGEVPVAGLTVAEAQRKVTSLLARDYLVKPQVEVRVREYQSQAVTVLGEVNSPGRKVLKGRTRLIDVLVESGGFTPRASGEVSLSRSDGTFAGGAATLTLRLGGALDPVQRVNLEVLLRNGDIVTASPKAYVTVEGEVNRPGRYTIDEDLTVTGAVTLAGGLTRFGSNDLRVRRIDPKSGKVQILEVDLKAVRKGKVPDLKLLGNDVVTVSRRLF
jgi:polysaccharide export outer membrane protein